MRLPRMESKNSLLRTRQRGILAWIYKPKHTDKQKEIEIPEKLEYLLQFTFIWHDYIAEAEKKKSE